MNADPHDRSNLVIAGLWLIGLAALLEFRWIWPGILFLGGATALVRAYYQPGKRDAARAGIAMILVGCWASLRFSLPALLVLIGVGMIVSALLRPATEPKPFVDRTLD